MSVLSKTINLRIPLEIVYRALMDRRLEKLFPEFFIGIEKKFIIDKTNKEIGFSTITKGKQIEIIEIFKLRITNNNCTVVDYITETKALEQNNIILESIIQTHVANVLYSLLMLETGYINGVLEKKSQNIFK